MKRLKLTKEKIQEWIEDYKDSIKFFESRGSRGDHFDFEHLARLHMLLGEFKKAREYFEESDKSWEDYLKRNEKYVKERWNLWDHINCYRNRMLIKFLAYGYWEARDYVRSNIDDIERICEKCCRAIEEDIRDKQRRSDQIAYEKRILLPAYLILKDEKALKVVEEIYSRFEKSKRKTYKKGSGYPTALYAKLNADVVKGIVEKNKDLFLKGFRELSDLNEKLIEGNPSDFADPELIFYLEIARELWPDIKVESSLIPEKLREKSYFELIR